MQRKFSFNQLKSISPVTTGNYKYPRLGSAGVGVLRYGPVTLLLSLLLMAVWEVLERVNQRIEHRSQEK